MASYTIREKDRYDSTLPSIHSRSSAFEYVGRSSAFARVRSPSPVRHGRPLSPRARPLSPSRIGRSMTPPPGVGNYKDAVLIHNRSGSPPLTNGHGTQHWRSGSPTGLHERALSPSRITRSLSPPPGVGHYQDAVLIQKRPISATYADKSRQYMDLQDQVRVYRDELSKKDRLISELTSVETPRVSRFDTKHIEEVYTNERLAASATAKSEIAGLTVRVEGLQSQNRELQGQVDIREDKIRELKLHVETARENEAKQGAIVQTLHAKLNHYESQAGSLEGAATRSEVAIQSLQRQTKEQQDRILELESRLRAHTDVRVRMDRSSHEYELKYNELLTQLSGLATVDRDQHGSSMGYTQINSHESVIQRLNDIVQESAMLKGKLQAMKEYITNAELETKASRETIIRLVSEAEREQRTVSKYTVEFDALRQERDSAHNKQCEYEREILLLKERLDASQRAWNATRAELEEREARFSRNDSQAREYELQMRSGEQSFRVFKEQIAALLSDSYVTVEPYEEQLRERLTALVRSSSDRKAHIELMESKVASLTQQLENQLGLQRSSENRAQKVEGEFYSLEDRLRRAEGELAAGDMLRDGMRADKEKYLRFLEHICTSLKMDPIAADMGLDGAADAILARINQIVMKEGDMMVDRKTHIYNLQRKIKSLKEQMDSKELHMDLLRKKVASMEERHLGRSEIEREKEEEFVKNRKLLKLVDKYKRELNECRMEMRDYKARLLESADIKTRTMQQEQELELLESKVGQLEHVRQKQAHKITGLKSELDDTVSRFGEKKNVAHHTVSTLTSELRSLKVAMQELTSRERQLLDLRQVIARMLGLDVNSLAVPDYEIISRLEKLILANQSNSATVVALDEALSDVSDGFRVGYENATRSMGMATRGSIGTRSRSPLKVTRSMGSRSMGRSTRARSLSPSRRRDYRQY